VIKDTQLHLHPVSGQRLLDIDLQVTYTAIFCPIPLPLIVPVIGERSCMKIIECAFYLSWVVGIRKIGSLRVEEDLSANPR